MSDKKQEAINLYREKKISLGNAAEMAEMRKADFIKLLSERKISIYNLDDEDLEEVSITSHETI